MKIEFAFGMVRQKLLRMKNRAIHRSEDEGVPMRPMNLVIIRNDGNFYMNILCKQYILKLLTTQNTKGEWDNFRIIYALKIM